MISPKAYTGRISCFSVGSCAGSLIETGPQSVTLKAVAKRIGRTHANLLHHFESASGLQKELATHLTLTVCETIKQAVHASRAGWVVPAKWWI